MNKYKQKININYKKNRNEIYAACPRVEEIENEIALVGVRIARMVLQNQKTHTITFKKLKKLFQN